MRDKILVIAAHPDDEILGCGGTISKHIKKKGIVHTLILGEGISSRKNKRNLKKTTNRIKQLRNQAIRANNIIGIKKLIHLNLPDNRFDSLDLLDLIKLVEDVIFKFKPDIIYTHSSSDLNIDHQMTNRAVVTACRPQTNFKVKKLFFFEIPSSTEWQNPENSIFKPNFHVNISSHINKKIKALKIYKNEMKKWPHPRSIEGVKLLSKLRGGQIGCNYAESFFLARAID